MKRLLIILFVVLLAGGCNSLECDGFSVGAVYLDTELLTNSSVDAGYLGQWDTAQKTKVEGLMPMFMFNFKFK